MGSSSYPRKLPSSPRLSPPSTLALFCSKMETACLNAGTEVTPKRFYGGRTGVNEEFKIPILLSFRLSPELGNIPPLII